MRLITAHRILIATGVAFFLFYAIFQLRLWARAGDTASLAQAVVSVAVAVGLVIYYRTLRRWGQR